MTQQILEEFKQQIKSLELQPFTDGRFEVFFNGKQIFSKLREQRFPEYHEIRSALTAIPGSRLAEEGAAS